MIFAIKKAVLFFLFPYRAGLLLVLAGTMLLWFTRKQKTGRWIVTLGLVILIVASVGIVANPLLNGLETRYPPLKQNESVKDVKWVVVLGGGAYPSGSLAILDRLSPETLARLTEGIRLLNQLGPSARMILSGGNPSGNAVEARVMLAAAQALGVSANRVRLEDKSLDTRDQARLVKDMVGQERFILVTSATHMHRAVALFKKQGLNPVPAPAGMIVKNSDGFEPAAFIPGVGSLGRTERAIYEYLGIAWAWLRGQV